MSATKRNLLILALGAGVAAGLFYRADSFWGLVCACLVAVWALIVWSPVFMNAREQGRRDLVDALVGALRRQDGGREQLVGVAVHERALDVRVAVGQHLDDHRGARAGTTRAGHGRTVPLPDAAERPEIGRAHV